MALNRDRVYNIRFDSLALCLTTCDELQALCESSVGPFCFVSMTQGFYVVGEIDVERRVMYTVARLDARTIKCQ